jgi:hypothetical protein
MLTRVRPLAVAVLAAAALAGAAGPAVAKPPGTPAIPLNTEQETTGSNTGANGFFSYRIDGDQFCYVLDVNGLSGSAVAAHVHVGPRHVAGPVEIPLLIPSAPDFTTSGCVTVNDTALLTDLQANPKAYYVNVHTMLFPGGEIRGQLK